MSIQLLGYSERGMVNALCHDLAHSPEGIKTLSSFLSWFDFPSAKTSPDFSNIKEATILVEQSFSNFGDLDLLILIDQMNGKKQAILLEAKVSTYIRSWKTVEERWKEFQNMFTEGVIDTSNLFVQLHRKVRLIDSISDDSNKFEPDFFVPIGKPGENSIVQKARAKLREYTISGNFWFCAILPDESEDLISFLRDVLINFEVKKYLPRWNTFHWGMLSWQTIKEKTKEGWPRTLDAFNWNEGQVFQKEQDFQNAVQPGQIYLLNNKRVFVVPSKQGENCRIVELDENATNYFWKTKKITLSELQPCDNQENAQIPYLPRKGLIYFWDPQNDDPKLPLQDETIDFEPGTKVKVIRASWDTCRIQVWNATDDKSVKVFTHHLQRII